MVIVDCPGIEDSDAVYDIVTEYNLPQGLGFVYVINSGNPGAIQKGRVSTDQMS